MFGFKYVKKTGFFLLAGATLCALVSVILYASNGAEAYFGSYVGVNGTVIATSVLALVCNIALGVSLFWDCENRIVRAVRDAVALAAVVLLAVALMFIVGDRVEVFAIVLGSDLEAGNAAATSAVKGSIAALVLYGITIVCNLVALFFSLKKEN